MKQVNKDIKKRLINEGVKVAAARFAVKYCKGNYQSGKEHLEMAEMSEEEDTDDQDRNTSFKSVKPNTSTKKEVLPEDPSKAGAKSKKDEEDTEEGKKKK